MPKKCPEELYLGQNLSTAHPRWFFPPVDSDDLLPEHTIIIEADIQIGSLGKNGETRVNQEICDSIIATCGDATIKTAAS